MTELDLSYNELGDDGARVVANCPHLAGLTVLRLSNCGIGDEGGRALANSPHLNRVESLDLESNPLGDAGLRPFRDTTYWRALRRLMMPRIGVPISTRNALDRFFNRPRRPCGGKAGSGERTH